MSNKAITNTIKFSVDVSMLGFVFLALKLAGVIDWPWIWVMAPFWVGPAITVAVILFMALIALVVLLAVAAVTAIKG